MRRVFIVLLFLFVTVQSLPVTASDSGSERILIFAPHPDDEALSSPGLVKKALSRGDKVKIVLFTCGDANTRSMNAMVEKYPDMTYDRDGDDDFDMIDYGILRHGESISGIKMMGLSPEDVIYMGYPDGGGARIWRSVDPQTSPYTNTDRVPRAYSFAYNPGSLYNRTSCLADFEKIIKDFDPTIVVTPRPTDTHGDHWALDKFVSQALDSLYADLSGFKAHLGYLIHWEKHQPNWPEDTSKWEQPLNHPKPHLEVVLADYDLSIDEKKKIIDQHFSQTLNFGRYLRNFSKETEIFWLESLGPHGSLEEILAF